MEKGKQTDGQPDGKETAWTLTTLVILLLLARDNSRITKCVKPRFVFILNHNDVDDALPAR